MTANEDTSPLHIGFLTTEYPPLPSGGIGTSMRNLGRALVARGHRVTVIGWGPEETFEDRGVAVRFLGATAIPKAGWLLNRWRASRALRGLVRTENLAIVETHDWCGPAAGMRLPCPLVIRCHGSATYFGDLLDEPVRRSVRAAEGSALRAADDVAAVSQFTGERTRALFRLPWPIRTIPNGIDPQVFQPGEPQDVEPDTILYFGTLVRKKGIIDLCRAFSEVVAIRPSARLRLIGRDAPDLRTGAASTWDLCRAELTPEAANRTHYQGALPYGEMQGAIQQAAVCAFPSFAEAMPLAWLEAMACARPVVAYDVGWAPEVIRHDSDGMLVPRGETAVMARTIVDLLASPVRAAQLGKAARIRVENDFSDDRVARRSLDWYRTVIGGHG